MNKIGGKFFGKLGGELNIIILHFDILHAGPSRATAGPGKTFS